MTIYLDSTPKLQEIAARIFEYKGRKFQMEAMQQVSCNSHWEGGSRSYYARVNLQDATFEVYGQSGTMFDRTPIPVVTLDEKTAVIEHSIFCGKDMGIRIIVHPSIMPKLLVTGDELSRDEKIVLAATRSLKSSYAGDGQFRFHEARRVTGIGLERWVEAKASLIDKGMLNKAGAITNDGRNAIARIDLHNLREEATE